MPIIEDYEVICSFSLSQKSYCILGQGYSDLMSNQSYSILYYSL